MFREVGLVSRLPPAAFVFPHLDGVEGHVECRGVLGQAGELVGQRREAVAAEVRHREARQLCHFWEGLFQTHAQQKLASQQLLREGPVVVVVVVVVVLLMTK